MSLGRRRGLRCTHRTFGRGHGRASRTLKALEMNKNTSYRITAVANSMEMGEQMASGNVIDVEHGVRFGLTKDEKKSIARDP
jgi:hypothetical protein